MPDYDTTGPHDKVEFESDMIVKQTKQLEA